MKGFNPHLENTRCRGSFLIATRYAIKEPIAPRGDGNGVAVAVAKQIEELRNPLPREGTETLEISLVACQTCIKEPIAPRGDGNTSSSTVLTLSAY